MSRGKKIVELFTNLETHIEDKGGVIDMGTGVIRANSTSEDACIGCWLADYFKTKAKNRYRHFRDGVKALEKYLGVDDMDLFLESNKQHWHNDYAAYAFHFGYAYDIDEYLNIIDVTDAWISFGEKLQTMED